MSRLREIYREAGRRAVPIEVMLELTHHCGFRCRHCYVSDFEAPDLLTGERVFRLLDELAEMGTLVLSLTGGEVLLRGDWLAIARQARERGFALHLFTNGWAVGERQADEIAGLEATVHVSVYSLEPAVFEAVTRRPGALERARGAVERLRARGARVVVKVPLTALNYRDAHGVRQWAVSAGAECRLDPTILARRDGGREPLGLRVAQDVIAGELGGPVLGCHPAAVREDEPLCAAASRFCCITPAGDVRACSVLPGSDGNVRERPFRDVWESSPWLQRVRAVRARDLRTCGTCPRLAYCGRCPGQALVEDGDLLGPSRWATRRAELIEAAWAERPTGS